ncbi:MAG: HNH endonuclease [Actinomycetota bacterium]|nr:HNH endonuclease [Actinomycetota bacterium]
MYESGLNQCDRGELIDGVGQLHGLECAARRQLLRFVAEVDRREIWKSDGARSTADWVSLRLDMDPRTSGELVEVAIALESLPHIAAAFETGALSWDKVRCLGPVARPEEDQLLANKARSMTLSQVRALARRRKHLSDIEAKSEHDRRFVRLSWGFERRYATLEGRLPAEQAATLEKALDRARDRIPFTNGDEIIGFEARSADALAEIAAGALAADADADRATLLVNVDAELLTTGRGGASLENGAPISPAVAERMSCDCRIQNISRDVDGRIVGIGEVSRSLPPWLRRELQRRDEGCRFPGCGRPRFLDGHHIQHWTKGGKTELPNLISLCRHHHKLLHEGGWSLRGDPAGEVTFVKPNGKALETGTSLLRSEVYDRIFSPDVAGPLIN